MNELIEQYEDTLDIDDISQNKALELIQRLLELRARV